jgi:hypothetical protein
MKYEVRALKEKSGFLIKTDRGEIRSLRTDIKGTVFPIQARNEGGPDTLGLMFRRGGD